MPDKIFGLALILDFIDRCHSLRSLHPPLAALPSLPPHKCGGQDKVSNEKSNLAAGGVGVTVSFGRGENCGYFTNFFFASRKKPGIPKDRLTDLSTFCPKMEGKPTKKIWKHNTKNKIILEPKKGKIPFFSKNDSVENTGKSVDNFDFLTLSTGFSTGIKISCNIYFGLHNINDKQKEKLNFLTHYHFAIGPAERLKKSS